MTASTRIKVKGMTCGNCVKHVTKALQGVKGVRNVKVDLASGEATLETDGPADMKALKEAVEDAGYELI